MVKVVEDILAKIMSKFLDDVSRDNVDAHLQSGKLEFHDLKLKKDLFDDLGSESIEMETGTIKEITVTGLGIKDIFRSEVDVVVDGINLKVQTRIQDSKLPGMKDVLSAAKLKTIPQQIEEMVENMWHKVKEIEAEEADELAHKFAARIFKNLAITLTNVTVVFVTYGVPMSIHFPTLRLASNKDLIANEGSAIPEGA